MIVFIHRLLLSAFSESLKFAIPVKTPQPSLALPQPPACILSLLTIIFKLDMFTQRPIWSNLVSQKGLIAQTACLQELMIPKARAVAHSACLFALP